MPTSLTDKEIEEFQGLYLREFLVELSKEEAEEMGLQLLQFMAVVIDITGAYFPTLE